MKITLIGSTSYNNKFEKYKESLEQQGHKVRIPLFDNDNWSEFDTCDYNRNCIKWADEVHVIWDGRSQGTIFDLGMCFALRKKIKVQYINPRNFTNFIEQYADMG